MTKACAVSLFIQRGLSLVEVLVFIVVVGIAVTGVMAVYTHNVRTSADPMVRKQALSVAESLLDEVLAKPYTYCDPDDANADTAVNAAGCATMPEITGPENASETRYASLTPFDNVNDYHGFTMTGINDLMGNPVAGLGSFNAAVQVASAGIYNDIPAGETLLVTVTVTGPGNHSVSLSGYRTRYAPTI